MTAGAFVVHYQLAPFRAIVVLKQKLSQAISEGKVTWDDKRSSIWSKNFELKEIISTYDGGTQKVYTYGTSSIHPMPLVVSLHTWSGDYSQEDPLAEESRKLNYNYIHPDFRGANKTFDACLSHAAIADIDDAIDYALKNFNVDKNLVFVVGASGGGYASVGHFFKTKHTVKQHMAWVPIVDLKAWYRQSLRKKQGYSDDIIKCTSKNGLEDYDEMKRRSPMYWEVPSLTDKKLRIFAGVDDGYTGSVPISHSIGIFNKIISSSGDATALVTTSDAMDLLSRNVSTNFQPIGGRDVFFYRKSTGVDLTIFDGGHEMLVSYVVESLKKIR